MYTCIHTYTPNCFRQSRRLHDALAGPDRGGQAVDLCLFYVSRTDRMKVAECLGQPHPSRGIRFTLDAVDSLVVSLMCCVVLLFLVCLCGDLVGLALVVLCRVNAIAYAVFVLLFVVLMCVGLF